MCLQPSINLQGFLQHMQYLQILFFGLCFVQLTLAAEPAWKPAPRETVVFLGDTFFERDYTDGQLEAALTLATARNDIRFRNLGWSGDTPRCESRSYFGPPAEGFDRLKKQLTEMKPTTVIACYGAVDAFEGEAGLASFLESYKKMLDMIQASCGASVVLLTPPAVSSDVKRWPSLANHNQERARYAKAIQQLALDRSLRCGDLFTLTEGKPWETVNGVTFNSADYEKLGPLLVQALGLNKATTASTPELRKTIVAKNQLFFYRWRPQNEIYLFGSRKHEQGRNSADIPLFDPLIAEQEQKISAILSKK